MKRWLLCLAVTMLSSHVYAAAQSEQALKQYFEGKRVLLKIDLPGTRKGTDLDLKSGSDGRALNVSQNAQRIRDNGVSIKEGESALVTRIKVTGGRIEFHLGDGGDGPSRGERRVSRPSKSQRQLDLEKQLNEEYAGYEWIAASNGRIPSSAVQGGRDSGGTLYVCRASYERGTHPGKIRSAFRGCNIGYGGQEVTVDRYEVLASGQGTLRDDWVRASGGRVPSDSVRGGNERGGSQLYVCRASYQGGVHPGKVRSGLAGCNIGFGGREQTVRSYEVLTNSEQKRVAGDAIAQLEEEREAAYQELVVAERERAAQVEAEAEATGRAPDTPGSRFNLRYGKKSISRNRTPEQVISDLSPWVDFP